MCPSPFLSAPDRRAAARDPETERRRYPGRERCRAKWQGHFLGYDGTAHEPPLGIPQQGGGYTPDIADRAKIPVQCRLRWFWGAAQLAAANTAIHSREIG